MKAWIGSLVKYKNIITGEKILCLVTEFHPIIDELTLVDCKTGKTFMIHHSNQMLEVLSESR